MRTMTTSRGGPRARARPWAIGVAAAVALLCAASRAPAGEGSAIAADTAGIALMEWAYDSWTVPWVQVRGTTHLLAPASHATLLTLACETADLERDRLTRHLSAQECEHRMAAIRADQDSALNFGLALHVFDLPSADALARLDPRVTFSLEDDRGRRWVPMEVVRGPAVPVTAGGTVKRIHYHPPWLRGGQHVYAKEYELVNARPLTVGEHRLRFARRDSRTHLPVISGDTRWLRLRLASGTNEWVATWAFRPDERR